MLLPAGPLVKRRIRKEGAGRPPESAPIPGAKRLFLCVCPVGLKTRSLSSARWDGAGGDSRVRQQERRAARGGWNRAGAWHEGRDFLDPPRAPGELGWLAHYRVRRCIGEGGMGLVFEAEDTDLLRSVALKVIRPELAGIPQVVRRFLREAQAMAALKTRPHRHHLPGRPAARHPLPGHGVSPRDVAAPLAGTWTQALGGPGAAARPRARRRPGRRPPARPDPPRHQAGQYLAGGPHRSGQDPRLRAGPNPEPRRADHESGSAVGTPAYMAPEQARGEGDDASCDLFSLGCVLYQLCTRRLPFPGLRSSPC